MDRLLFRSLLLTIGVTCALVAPERKPGSCQAPEWFQRPSPFEFTARSSMLQVATGAPITCSGKLTHWSFVATSSYIVGAHFFVWRPLGRHNDATFFKPIGVFSATSKSMFQPYAWVTLPSDPIIDVKEGDVIGVYYDDWRADDANGAGFIPVSSQTSYGINSNVSLTETLVSPKSRSKIGYEVSNHGIVDMSEAAKSMRAIALQATVEQNPVQSGHSMGVKLPTSICHMSPTSGTCMSLMPTYYYDETLDQCRLFLWSGCGGNENRFRTRQECEATCSPLSPNRRVSGYFGGGNNYNAIKVVFPTLPPIRQRPIITTPPTTTTTTAPMPIVVIQPIIPAPAPVQPINYRFPSPSRWSFKFQICFFLIF